MGLFDEKENGIGKKIRKTLIAIALKFIIPPVLIIVLLASFWYIIGKNTVKTVSNVIRTNGINTNITKVGRTYKIDESIAENVNKKLKEQAISTTNIALSDELLKKFYEAEIITSFPDLREKNKIGTPVAKGEIQGCIQFKRDGQIIEYMPFNEFQSVLTKFGYSLEDSNGNAPTINNEEVYKKKEQVEAKYAEELKGYFTLDEENNLIIAKISSQEVITRYNAYAQAEMPRNEEDEDSEPVGYERQYTYNVGIEKINYQTELQKYSMPIEFLTSLLMVSQNSGFCEAVANLAKNSKILIEIQDNISTTQTEEKYDYISHFYARKQYEYQYEVEVTSEPKNQSEQTSEENLRTQTVTNRKVVVRDDLPIPTPNPNNGGQNNGDTGDENQEQNQGQGQQEQEQNQSENEQNTQPTKKTETTTKNATGVYIKGRNMDNPYRTVVTTTKNNRVNLCVVEAKTWLLEAKAEYNKTQEETTTTNTIGLDYKEKDEDGWTIPAPEDIDLEEYKDVNDCHDLLDKLTHSNLPNDATKVANSSNNIEEVKEKKDDTEETTIINIKTEEVKYTKVSSEVINKEENFLSLLRVDPTNNNVFNKENISKNTKLIKYKNLDGRNFSPEDNILSATQVLFSYIASSEHSQSYEETMRYLLYLYTGKSYGVTSFDFSLYEPSDFTRISSRIYSGTLEEKVWFALKDLGYSDIAVAGAMGNFYVESNFKTNNLEDSYQIGGRNSLGYTDETYTQGVDDGTYSLEKFISDHVKENCGAGYGLAQWTYYTRKERLYNYAKHKEVSIADENMQLEFLMGELNVSGGADGYALYVLSPGQGFQVDDWINATTPEIAARAFCGVFEKGTWVDERGTKAREYYDKYQGLERVYVSGKEIIEQHVSSITGRLFTIFDQTKISGWGSFCNRAAFISVCSGYYNESPLELINIANTTATMTSQNIIYNNNAYKDRGLISQYGPNTLTAEAIRRQLQSGGYILPYLKGRDKSATGYSKYGNYWAKSMHWVAILDYKVENGEELIFVSDSGHNQTGWHPIDEFDGMIDHTLFINEI